MRKIAAARTRRLSASAFLAALALCGGASAAWGQGTDDTSVAAALQTGNPIARVSLDRLAATRERPLFWSSRRAAAPPRPPEAPPPAGPPAPAAAEQPRLTLTGIVVSSSGVGSAIFFDETDRTFATVKLGQNRRGWALRSIDGRTVMLAKQGQTVKLAIQPAKGVVVDDSD